MTRTMLIIATVATGLVTLTSAANASFNDANNAEDFVRAEVGLDIVYKHYDMSKLEISRLKGKIKARYRPRVPKITTWDKIKKGK